MVLLALAARRHSAVATASAFFGMGCKIAMVAVGTAVFTVK